MSSFFWGHSISGVTLSMRTRNYNRLLSRNQFLDEEESEEEESELKKLYPETYKTNERRLLRGK